MLPPDSAFNTAIFNALCSCLELSSSSAEASDLIRRAYQDPESAPKPGRNQNVIYYDVAEDDAALRAAPEDFEALRGSYRIRREFPAYTVRLSGGEPADSLRDSLRGLGFKLD